MAETWNRMRSPEELEQAIESNNKGRVRELVQSLVAYVYQHHDIFDERDAESILRDLRKRRLFEDLRLAADAFLNNECSTFQIRKLHAQALLDLGQLAAAEDVLVRLRDDADRVREEARGARWIEAQEEWQEACGLLGRLNKDRYVNAHAPDVERNQKALERAIGCYYDCYQYPDAEPEAVLWHGINAVALVRLAQNHGLDIDTGFDSHRVARNILREIERGDPDKLDRWKAANAMEANIALGDWDDALTWAKEYVDPSDEGVDAFEIASTLRQLQDVWEIKVTDAEDPGSKLIALLRTRLMELDAFGIELKQEEPIDVEFLAKQADSLEKQFGGEFLSFRRYSDGLSRARAVARIGDEPDRHVGTGFLVEGGALHPSWEGKRFLVTNDHVVSDTNPRKVLRPRRAVATFRAGGGAQREFHVQRIVWHSPQEDLDVTILELKEDTQDLPSIPVAQERLPSDAKRVLIFGYAQGGALAFSLGDNRLVDRDERFLQYRAPTVSGSSGSPVFNTDWELIAVHHRGGYALQALTTDEKHQANQGASIFAIKEAIEEDLE